MALSETKAYKIEINEDRSIGVRCANIVIKDGAEIARSYARSSYSPGADVTAEPQEVQDVAALVWTAEVIAAYEASLPTSEPEAAAY